MPTDTNNSIVPLHSLAPASPFGPPEAGGGTADEAPDCFCEDETMECASDNKYSPAFKAGRFKPGQTGNPGGRKRIDNEIRKMLADGTKESVKALCDIVSNSSISPKVRCFAAQIILDRVYGKATQPIDAIVGGRGEPVVFEFRGILDEWAK
jgi:hypothetical protein